MAHDMANLRNSALPHGACVALALAAAPERTPAVVLVLGGIVLALISGLPRGPRCAARPCLFLPPLLKASALSNGLAGIPPPIEADSDACGFGGPFLFPPWSSHSERRRAAGPRSAFGRRCHTGRHRSAPPDPSPRLQSGRTSHAQAAGVVVLGESLPTTPGRCALPLHGRRPWRQGICLANVSLSVLTSAVGGLVVGYVVKAVAIWIFDHLEVTLLDILV